MSQTEERSPRNVVPISSVMQLKKKNVSMSPEDFEFIALAGRGGFGNVRIITPHSSRLNSRTCLKLGLGG